MAKLPPSNSILMREWNIVVIEYKGDVIEKFIGYDLTRNQYRLSSQIVEFDAESNTGRTFSGSNYTFLDKPGLLNISAQDVYERLYNHQDLSVTFMF